VASTKCRVANSGGVVLLRTDDFRRRFRLRRSLFETVVNALVEDEHCNYFVQRPDATGLLGFLPEQKVTCALRMLAYGASADQLDELIRIGESTALETLKVFCSSIIRLFGPEYLRKPTQHDLESLLTTGALLPLQLHVYTLKLCDFGLHLLPSASNRSFRALLRFLRAFILLSVTINPVEKRALLLPGGSDRILGCFQPRSA
jgi:hypothetical protein